MPRRPSAVELGFMFGGSETDRSEGSLFGTSLKPSARGSSRGVVASEEVVEPGEPGVVTAGVDSAPLIAEVELAL